jgi:MFS transporter, OCT family, solute carrier family 22 (organic cation transporter), member 4/5
MEFDPPLICEEKSTASLLQSLVYMGSLVGFFIFSFVADNYGRKLGLGLAWFMATIGSAMLGVID